MLRGLTAMLKTRLLRGLAFGRILFERDISPRPESMLAEAEKALGFKINMETIGLNDLQRCIALRGIVAERMLHHFRPVLTRDIERPIRAERIKHDALIGPRQRVETSANVVFFVLG